MNINDYVDVAERVQQFYDKYPEGSLQPLDPHDPFSIIERDGVTFLVYVAAAYRDPMDPRPGIGTAWELLPGKTSYTQGSELMVAETSAWGRALAALGFATKRIATKEEVQAAEARRTVERITEPVDDDPWAQPLLNQEPQLLDHEGPTCVHGARIKRTGRNAKGDWVGWFCPQPRGSKDQCPPKFGGAA